MTKNKNTEIVLPALRGFMGDWIFYSCLMDIKTLATRVDYASEIHSNEFLSDMIQRKLKTSRSAQIATYLQTQKERLFNALVVATYGGRPNWHALSDVKGKNEVKELQNLDEDITSSVGFLTFRGDEKLFALDGQHRLSGIKRAFQEGINQDPYDDIPVIFVAHKNGPKGLERTRRLFTTLNKTARPVSKGDIIALDEDDVMAITVRQLIEKSSLFSGKRIAFVASNNMPSSNTTSLTTIGNLYDVLEILFTSKHMDLKKSKSDLQRARPSDENLQAYFGIAEGYFAQMKKHFEDLNVFFKNENTEAIVKKCRGAHGGNALFRPIGLEIFTMIIVRLSKDISLEQAVKRVSKLPTNLASKPYEGLMWDKSNKTILNGHRVTLREILMHMVGVSKYSEATLRERYRKEMGDDTLQLPKPVI